MKVEVSSFILAFDLLMVLSEATIKKRAQWSDKTVNSILVNSELRCRSVLFEFHSLGLYNYCFSVHYLLCPVRCKMFTINLVLSLRLGLYTGVWANKSLFV